MQQQNNYRSRQRQRTLSNYSSINTPKFKHRPSSASYQNIFFSQVLLSSKQNNENSNIRSSFNQHIIDNNYEQSILPQIQKSIINTNNSQYPASNNNKNNQKYPNTQQQKIAPTQFQHYTTPSKDLYMLFKNNRISAQYIQQMQIHKFKPLIIVSVILPYEQMRKFIKLLNLENQYLISMPGNAFAMNFNKLTNKNQTGSNSASYQSPTQKNEQINYTFWFHQVPASSLPSQQADDNINIQNGNYLYGNMKNSSLKSSNIDLRASNKSSKTQKQIKYLYNNYSNNTNPYRDIHSDAQIYSKNMQKIMVDIPQIVITSINYIKEHPNLFFPNIDSQIMPPARQQSQAGSSAKIGLKNGYLHNQLDIEKTLFYFDDEFNQSNEGEEFYKQRNNDYKQKDVVGTNKLQNQLNGFEQTFGAANVQKNNKVRHIAKNKDTQQNQRQIQYIEIEPQEQFYDQDDRRRQSKPMLKFVQNYQSSGNQNQIDNIPTIRSHNQQNFENHSPSYNPRSNNSIHQILQKQSIFKSINCLSEAYWFTNYIKTTTHQQKSTNPPPLNKNNPHKHKSSFNDNRNIYDKSKSDKFIILLTQQIKLSIKKNLNYSLLTSSWFFLHFLSNCLKLHTSAEQKLQNQLHCNYIVNSSSSLNFYSLILQKSLKTFKKQIQLRFYTKLQNEYKELIDEGSLRKMLRQLKKQQTIFMKKNLAAFMFPNKFINAAAITSQQGFYNSTLNNNNKTITTFMMKNTSQSRLNKQYLQQIQNQLLSYMSNLCQQIYFQNNKRAIEHNQKILQTEYQKIIEAGFRRQKNKKKESFQSISSLNSDERPILSSQPSQKSIGSPKRNTTSTANNNRNSTMSQQLQKDFTKFMESYNSKGVKVSSQLKSFNSFMQKKKSSYLKTINHLSKNQKNNQQQEQYQKQNKKRIMKILQMQIIKLQDRRKQVRDKNQIIKRQIKIVDERNLSNSREKSFINGGKDPNKTTSNRFGHNKNVSANKYGSATMEDNFISGNKAQNSFNSRGNQSIIIDKKNTSLSKNQKLRNSSPHSFEISSSNKKKSIIKQQRHTTKSKYNSKRKTTIQQLQNDQSNRQRIINEQQQRIKKKGCLHGKCCQIM